MARPPNTNHCITEGAKAHLDDELELGRLTGGQVSWPLAFQNFADMDAGLARLASTLRQASMMYLRASAGSNRDPSVVADSNAGLPNLAFAFSTAFRADRSSFNGDALRAPAKTATSSSASRSASRKMIERIVSQV